MANNLPALFEDSDLSGLPTSVQTDGRPWLDGVVPTVGPSVVGGGVLGEMTLGEDFILGQASAGLLGGGVLGEMTLGEDFILGDAVAAEPVLAVAHTHTFDSLLDKPTTLAGYGITDGGAGGLSEAEVQVLIEATLTDPTGVIVDTIKFAPEGTPHIDTYPTANGFVLEVRTQAGLQISAHDRSDLNGGAILANDLDLGFFIYEHDGTTLGRLTLGDGIFNSLLVGGIAPSLVGHTHAFADLTDKPTTLAGYGITDGQPLDATLTSLADDGQLILGSAEPIYEESGSIRVGEATRSIYGGAFVITREHTADSNAHGIDENSTINPSGPGRSYAAFDARGQLTASQNMGHYVGYQFDPIKSGSGDIDEFGALTSSISVSAGTVGSLRHIQISDSSVTGTGAITDQYGLLIQGLVAATTNWAIYCVAPTKSYHGGDIAFAGVARTPSATIDVLGTIKAGGTGAYQVMIGRPFTGTEGGLYINVAGTWSEIQAMQEGVGYFPLVLQRRGGNVTVGTTTDNGKKLQVAGAMSLAPGSSVTPSANGELVFEATNNTTITVKLKGSDGTVRSGTITLS